MYNEKEDELGKINAIAQDIREARDKFDHIYNRCKRDLEVANGIEGSQYGTRDKDIRGENRAQFSFPILDKFIERVIGNYNISPFGIQYEANNEDVVAKARIVSSIVKGIENRSKAKDVYRTALRNLTTVGYGWIHVTTEYDNPEDDSLDVSIKIEGVTDYSSVLIDPLSTEIDGSDARWIAHRDAISIQEAKATYGEDVCDFVDGGLFDSDINHNESDSVVPIVTYYSKEEKKEQVYIDANGNVSDEPLPDFMSKLKIKTEVTCTKLVGNKIISEMTLEGMKSIPLVPTYGLPVFHDSTLQSVGIIHRATDTQTLLDYAGSLTAERLALGPKANYIADADSISPFMEIWKNSAKANVPVLPFRSFDEKTNRALPAPIKQDNAVNVSDVVSLQSQFINITSSIIGMPDMGMAGQSRVNETAEAALLRERSQETILSTLYENLASSITQVGKIVVEMLASTYNDVRKVPIVKDGKQSNATIDFNELDIIPSEYQANVTSGPMMASQRKENLRSLLAVSSMLGPQGVALLPEIVSNIDLDDSKQTIKSKVEMLAQQSLNAQNIAQSQEQMAQLTQTNQMLQQQVAILQQELNKSQSNITSAEIKAQTDILKTRLNNEAKMDLERLKQGGSMIENKQQAELDAEKMILEERMELEKQFNEERLRLEETQMKLNQLELINKTRGVGY